tara:strand:+ start:226 stop:732 length:507 start_codon:yes stop_codon:yes gene_type:complete
VELAKSFQKECLLLVVGEGKSLEGLGAMVGSLLDGLGGDSSSLGIPLVLGDGGGLVDGLMSDVELVNLSEGLSGLGLRLLGSKTVLVSLSRLVMEAGQVHLVGVEALESGFSTLLLNLECGTLFGQSPHNISWKFHLQRNKHRLENREKKLDVASKNQYLLVRIVNNK